VEEGCAVAGASWLGPEVVATVVDAGVAEGEELQPVNSPNATVIVAGTMRFIVLSDVP
jgi:hypothetical protein